MTARLAGRLARATAWLFAAQIVLGGLYWAFLLTPESNVLMLAASVLLLAAMLVVVGMAVGGAIGIWHGEGVQAGGRRPGRTLAAALLAAALLHVVYFVAESAVHRLLEDEAGISAALMARFGVADASPLFRAGRGVAWWVSWVVGPLLGCSAFAAWRADGPRALARAAWLRRAVAPRALLTASLAVWLLVYWPWQGVRWRPAALAPTWVEPAVAAGKLALILLAISAAWALVVRVASRPAPAAATAPSSAT